MWIALTLLTWLSFAALVLYLAMTPRRLDWGVSLLLTALAALLLIASVIFLSLAGQNS